MAIPKKLIDDVKDDKLKIDIKGDVNLAELLGASKFEKLNYLLAFKYIKVRKNILNALIKKTQGGKLRGLKLGKEIQISDLLGEPPKLGLLQTLKWLKVKNQILKKVGAAAKNANFEFGKEIDVNDILGSSPEQDFITKTRFFLLRQKLLSKISSAIKDFNPEAYTGGNLIGNVNGNTSNENNGNTSSLESNENNISTIGLSTEESLSELRGINTRVKQIYDLLENKESRTLSDRENASEQIERNERRHNELIATLKGSGAGGTINGRSIEDGGSGIAGDVLNFAGDAAIAKGLLGGRRKGKRKGRSGRFLGFLKRTGKGLLGRRRAVLGGAGIAGALATSKGLFSNKPPVPIPSAPITKQATETAGKQIAKTTAKATTKGLVKKIPIIGAIAGLGFGLSRALKGDFAGAGMEVSSGLASTVPGLGTAASVGIDATLLARDVAKIKKDEDASKGGGDIAPQSVDAKERFVPQIRPKQKETAEDFEARMMATVGGDIAPQFATETGVQSFSSKGLSSDDDSIGPELKKPEEDNSLFGKIKGIGNMMKNIIGAPFKLLGKIKDSVLGMAGDGVNKLKGIAGGAAAGLKGIGEAGLGALKTFAGFTPPGLIAKGFGKLFGKKKKEEGGVEGAEGMTPVLSSEINETDEALKDAKREQFTSNIVANLASKNINVLRNFDNKDEQYVNPVDQIEGEGIIRDTQYEMVRRNSEGRLLDPEEQFISPEDLEYVTSLKNSGTFDYEHDDRVKQILNDGVKKKLNISDEDFTFDKRKEIVEGQLNKTEDENRAQARAARATIRQIENGTYDPKALTPAKKESLESALAYGETTAGLLDPQGAAARVANAGPSTLSPAASIAAGPAEVKIPKKLSFMDIIKKAGNFAKKAASFTPPGLLIKGALKLGKGIGGFGKEPMSERDALAQKFEDTFIKGGMIESKESRSSFAGTSSDSLFMTKEQMADYDSIGNDERKQKNFRDNIRNTTDQEGLQRLMTEGRAAFDARAEEGSESGGVDEKLRKAKEQKRIADREKFRKSLSGGGSRSGPELTMAQKENAELRGESGKAIAAPIIAPSNISNSQSSVSNVTVAAPPHIDKTQNLFGATQLSY